MAASDRTVRHLRLRAPSAAAAAQAALRLEDALRCASLPDAGARVLLVRRLALGRLPAGLSSQSLSLLIERRVADVGGEWVHGSEARAAHSNAVFFASRLQAAQAALQRRAEGLPLDAWHWHLALPGVAVQAPPAEFLTQLLTVWLQQPEAAAALPVLFADRQAPVTRAWCHAHLPAAWRETLRPFMPHGRASHGSVTDTVRHPAPGTTFAGADRSADPDGARKPGAGGGEGVGTTPPPGRRRRASSTAPDPGRRTTATGAAHTTPAAHTPATRAALRRAPAAVAPSPSATMAPPAAPAPPDATPLWWDGHRAAREGPLDTAATQAGGLLFLWPVLQRLGLAACHAEAPDAWLAPRVLTLVLQRLRLPDEDPAWALLASLPQATAEPLPAHDAMVRWWWHACHIHLRRTLRIGLPQLVLRSAGLRWTPTHIDVHFRSADADLRVRAAGLDIDPGWVVALQRVVAFHYDREGAPP